MTKRIMMGLGGFQFQIETAAYDRLRRVHEYRWPAQELIGQQPVRQFTGPGNQSIELSGVIYPHFKGGLGQIDAMRRQADTGTALHMADGLGKVWGQFCITRIEEGQTFLNDAGQPRKQTFRLELAAYGGVS